MKYLIKNLIPRSIKKAARVLRNPNIELIKPTFHGWSMTSILKPPESFTDFYGKEWINDQTKMVKLVDSEEIILTQFGTKENGLIALKKLQWRHYLVQISVNRAYLASKRINKDLVCTEFGVCDGLTSWFALSILKRLGFDGNFDLFDAWASMRSSDLLPSEKKSAGKYGYLSLERTKMNLNEFNKKCNYIKGYLPETLPKEIPDKQFHWIHIDVNNALITKAILDKYFSNPASGSIVLLDDYGHLSYEDTRKEIDKWIFSRKDKFFLEVLPTGQAIIEAK